MTAFSRRDLPARGGRRGSLAAVAFALAAVIAGCDAAATAGDTQATDRAGERREIISPAGATRIASYSSAVRTGHLIFFSGVVGTLPDSRELAAGGIQPELRQSWHNLSAIMEAADVTADDLVKCTVFLADIAEFDAMNDVYSTFFPGDPPARSTVGVAGLPLGARVELECIAAVR